MNNEYYLYGLQRSGTNYLRKLVELNLGFYTRNKKGPRSWKHRLDIPDNINDYVNIVLYKNPYKWLDSLHRNPEDFFERQTLFPCLNEDGSYNLTNIAKTYKHFMETWVLSDVPTLNIRYEDLLKDKSEALVIISEMFDLTYVPTEIIEPKSVLNSKKFTSKKKDYYLKADKTEYLSESNIAEVNEILDDELMEKLGYKKL